MAERGNGRASATPKAGVSLFPGGRAKPVYRTNLADGNGSNGETEGSCKQSNWPPPPSRNGLLDGLQRHGTEERGERGGEVYVPEDGGDEDLEEHFLGDGRPASPARSGFETTRHS